MRSAKLIGGTPISDDDPLQVVVLQALPEDSATATDIALGEVSTVVAATHQVGSAPSGATNGHRINATGYGGRIRTFFDFTSVSSGVVSACRVRLYLREPGGTAWYAGISTDDLGGFRASGGMLVDSAFDWDIGENAEFTFVVEAITQTNNSTVAVKVAGVTR